MFKKIRIFEIRKDALNSLKKNLKCEIENSKSIRTYYILSFAVAIGLFVLGVSVSSEMADYFITGISIFSGLFFNLLIVITEKFEEKRKTLSINPTLEQKDYIQRLKCFSIKIIAQISHSIVLSVLLILSFVLTKIDIIRILCLDVSESAYVLIERSASLPVFLFGTQFLFFLLIVLSGLYSVLLDGVENNILES